MSRILELREAIRDTGIDVIGRVPWSTHFCQFYETKYDLVDILVPYFKAGLENSEFCVWVTSEDLSTDEAKAALRSSVPNLDEYLNRGQIEILPYTDWYLKDGEFDQDRVLGDWVKKLNYGLAKGYDGLRVSGNTCWLEKKDWADFAAYEDAINNVIGDYYMLVLCTYSLGKCGASEIAEVVANHQFALIMRHGEWQVIETSEYKQSKEALRRSEERYRTLFESMNEGFALHEIICDEYGEPYDYRFLDVNPGFEKLTGLRREDVIGRTVLEILPGTEKYWIDTYRRVALTGQPTQFENYSGMLKRHFEVIAFSPAKHQFACLFVDITARKQAEEWLRKNYERERTIAETLQESLLSPVDISLDEFGILGHYQPALAEANVGGDFYDAFWLRDGRLAFMMGDVSGKGLHAAVHTAMAKYMLRAYASKNPEPAHVLQQLNEALCDFTSDEQFITIFYGVLDLEKRTITYANAGHNEPLIYRHESRSVSSIDLIGRAAGVLCDSEYEQETAYMHPGDVLLLYTDGITDARTNEGFFGLDGLSDVLTANARNSEKHIIDSIYEAAMEYAGGDLRDDAAVLVIKAH